MELHEKFRVCGVLQLEGTEVEVFTDPSTGSLLYHDEFSGRNLMIGGISDRTPKGGMDARALSKKLNSGAYGEGVIGVIYCEKYIIVITSESTCEIRPYNAIKVPADKSYEINLDIDVEE